MMPDALDPLLLSLPVLAGLSGFFAFAFASVKVSRHYALCASLAISMLVALLGFLTGFGGPAYLSGALPHAALAILLAQLIAAPVLDRARFFGLLAGSVLGSFAILYLRGDVFALLLPTMPSHMAVIASIVAASLCGLIGSALLPAHPARAVRAGQLRLPIFSYARDVGLVLCSIAVMALTTPSAACAVSAITAALCPLLLRRDAYRLHRAAEGVLAGTLIALLLPEGHAMAVLYGVAAAVLAARGEHIAGGLRLDDPARITGTVLLPAMAGMLLPFVNDIALLADAIRWLGSTLLAGAGAALLWLPIMATVGFAASTRRVREGLDFI